MQVDHSNPITLSRFVLAEKELQKNTELSILFTSIELACKVIASAVRRAGMFFESNLIIDYIYSLLMIYFQ